MICTSIGTDSRDQGEKRVVQIQEYINKKNDCIMIVIIIKENV